MKIFIFTTLYPNNIYARHGIFVETRLRNLLNDTQLKATVIAPVPWFPVRSNKLGRYGKLAQVDHEEQRFDIQIKHPRFLVIPIIGKYLTSIFLALAAIPTFRKLIKEQGKPQIIDAHYFYPDGVSAVLLGKWFNIPVTITARGSDINLFQNFSVPRKMIQWAIKNCSHIITVSNALKKEIIKLGSAENKITTLRNGVDTNFFKPAENRTTLREKLNLTKTTILSVGNLLELKGHHLVIEAIKKLDDVELLIAGDGEYEKYLKDLCRQLNLEDKVRFLGVVSQQQLVEYYAAVDILTLMSSREGWANVLLESMACGTPVIATNVGGTPELLQNTEAGIMINREVPALVEAIQRVLDNPPPRNKVRNYAETFSWLPISQGQIDIFENINPS